jgi:hypothetical protein
LGQKQATDLTRDIANSYKPISNKLDLPKYKFENPAQQGGEKIGLLVELLASGVGLFRASTKAGSKIAKESARSSQKISNGVKILHTARRVETRPGEAFFWSGRTNGVGGQDVAAELAKQKGGTTLEMLIEQNKIIMPAWNPEDLSAIKAWEDISAEYAMGASGHVRAVIGQSLRPGNIWETKELPRLMKNPNVTEITIIDPVSHAEKTIFKR